MKSGAARRTLGGTALILLASSTAHAQLDGQSAAGMQECRKISDVAARAECYDNIPLEDPLQVVQSAAPSATSFGSDQVSQPAPARVSASGKLVIEVARAEEREPGVYLLTLEEGAQWLFVDAVAASYDPPHSGAMIEISSASMGSYLMRYRGQRGIRIRRIQ